MLFKMKFKKRKLSTCENSRITETVKLQKFKSCMEALELRKSFFAFSLL